MNDIQSDFERLPGLAFLQKMIVERRRSPKQLLNGSFELEAWLSIAESIQKLSHDAQSRQQAFAMIKGICWELVADLWNIKKERQLAYMISKHLLPMASEALENDVAEVLRGIVTGRYG